MRKREVIATAAAVLGWLLLTVALAGWISPLVWPASLGIMLLCAVGIRGVGRVLWVGVYQLSKRARDEGAP